MKCDLSRSYKSLLTRTPSRGPFVLARTVVLVSAFVLLGYLPLANPLTAPSHRERPPGGGSAAILPLRLRSVFAPPA